MLTNPLKIRSISSVDGTKDQKMSANTMMSIRISGLNLQNFLNHYLQCLLQYSTTNSFICSVALKKGFIVMPTLSINTTWQIIRKHGKFSRVNLKKVYYVIIQSQYHLMKYWFLEEKMKMVGKIKATSSMNKPIRSRR